ncbi:MAG: NAD-dependent epimerase/dehydratase family protein [Humibacillus sp.]|nr:NAD-dependent epimerase/dehydratase family protein [Humibacillus sp.]MDN5780169.1 NAD-dependent epimerase/dehydratase family protein [Humibacillus sp.]
MPKVVLVTGVSRYLGGLFVRRLGLDPSIDRILGVDVVPPKHSIGRAEFVRADIRNPMIGRIIAQADVDTVVHMNVIATPKDTGGRVTQKEINVIGTMQLLAACQKSDSVKRLVVKSSAAIYGSSPRDPAMFSEDMNPKSLPRTGFGKDSVEVEGYVRGFSRRRPDVDITMLRFANIIGPSIRTAITDYFSLPVIPVPAGFDARFQFVHEDDAMSALALATTGASVGIVNVAGEGFLTVLQCAAIARRPILPVPLSAAGVIGNLVKRSGLADFSSEQLTFLAFGRGLDTQRMATVLGFEPQHSTRATFEEFARHLRPLVPVADHGENVGGAVSTAAGGTAGALSRVFERIQP